MRPTLILAAVLAVLCAASPALAEDRLFHHDSEDLQRFNGRPMWDGAAVCAAFEATVERQIELRRARWAQQFALLPAQDRSNPRYAYPEERDGRARTAAAESRRQWREFGLMRLTRDRPAQDAGVLFDYRVMEARPGIEAGLSSFQDTEAFEYSCAQFRRAVEENRTRMMRGWPDQPGRN